MYSNWARLSLVALLSVSTASIARAIAQIPSYAYPWNLVVDQIKEIKAAMSKFVLQYCMDGTGSN